MQKRGKLIVGIIIYTHKLPSFIS